MMQYCHGDAMGLPLCPPTLWYCKPKAGLWKPMNGSSSLQIGQPQSLNEHKEGACCPVAERPPDSEGETGRLGSCRVTRARPSSPGLSLFSIR